MHNSCNNRAWTKVLNLQSPLQMGLRVWVTIQAHCLSRYYPAQPLVQLLVLTQAVLASCKPGCDMQKSQWLSELYFDIREEAGPDDFKNVQS